MNISGSTAVYGIIGSPIRHTLSPVIHNTLAAVLGDDLIYTPFSLPRDADMEKVLSGAHSLGIRGMNVTVPFKEAVIPYLISCDPFAKRTGAVNTLKWSEEGYRGYNTDLPGLRAALLSAGRDLKGCSAVVLGAGGAARSVLTLLQMEEADRIFLLNRSPEKAKALAEEINTRFKNEKIVAFQAEEYQNLPHGGHILFQCTSLGLREGDGLLVQDPTFYKDALFGYDLIYNPAETPFTKLLDRFSIPAENGLSMLLYQGIIAYEIWRDQKVPEEVRDQVFTKLKRMLYGENTVLVGYMGAGKTTVGKLLAERTGSSFIDTDEEIQREAGMTIPEIFEKEGEEGFRNRETAILEKLSQRAVHSVIATGGGAVLRKENRDILQEMGKVIFLAASDETVLKRVGEGEGRPLLSGKEELSQKISAMQTRRRAAYEAAAEKTISTDKMTPEEIADSLASL